MRCICCFGRSSHLPEVVDNEASGTLRPGIRQDAAVVGRVARKAQQAAQRVCPLGRVRAQRVCPPSRVRALVLGGRPPQIPGTTVPGRCAVGRQAVLQAQEAAQPRKTYTVSVCFAACCATTLSGATKNECRTAPSGMSAHDKAAQEVYDRWMPGPRRRRSPWFAKFAACAASSGASGSIMEPAAFADECVGAEMKRRRRARRDGRSRGGGGGAVEWVWSEQRLPEPEPTSNTDSRAGAHIAHCTYTRTTNTVHNDTQQVYIV